MLQLKCCDAEPEFNFEAYSARGATTYASIYIRIVGALVEIVDETRSSVFRLKESNEYFNGASVAARRLHSSCFIVKRSLSSARHHLAAIVIWKCNV